MGKEKEEKSWAVEMWDKIFGDDDKPATKTTDTPSMRMDVRSNKAGLDAAEMEEAGIGSQQDAVQANNKKRGQDNAAQR